jgi:hypothetical protein
MAMMASHFSTIFEIWDAFIIGKVEINKKENEMKIKNLETTRDLSIITKKITNYKFFAHVV